MSRDISTLSPVPGSIGAATEPDPELLALPAPPKRERTATVSLMALTAIASIAMAFSLRGEAGYAISPGTPAEIGDLTKVELASDVDNRYVRGEGLSGTAGAIRYGRAAEGDSFRLAPVAGNPSVWVEIRVPEGFEGPRFVPPTTYAGRLVRLDEAGVRHIGLRRAVHNRTGENMPAGAWILIDGASPRASRWALALATLFVGFAAWNIAGMVRLLRRARDD